MILMVTYIIFTRLRTRDPEHTRIYRDAWPKTLVGHNTKKLALFGTLHGA